MPNVIDRLITDRTYIDVRNLTAKGVYTAEDLNRVEEAVQYLDGFLSSRGYETQVQPMRTWSKSDIPDFQEMRRFLDNVRAIKDAVPLPGRVPIVPDDMDMLTYQEANNIEKILLAVYQVALDLSSPMIYSGQIWAGMI